ncbi:MAG: hypothetical protein E6925_03895 [Actinomyces sp.]|nr:hypothetical protein [Actinomyces sp.]MDU1430833.1 hypothetical protein [Actinomyces sp.]
MVTATREGQGLPVEVNGNALDMLASTLAGEATTLVERDRNMFRALSASQRFPRRLFSRKHSRLPSHRIVACFSRQTAQLLSFDAVRKHLSGNVLQPARLFHIHTDQFGPVGTGNNSHAEPRLVVADASAGPAGPRRPLSPIA